MTETIVLSPEAEKLRPALDALPVEDRLRLALYLRKTAEVADDPVAVRTAWAAEIRRRVEEIKSGKVEGIPADEVFREMREKYP